MAATLNRRNLNILVVRRRVFTESVGTGKPRKGQVRGREYWVGIKISNAQSMSDTKSVFHRQLSHA